MRKAIVVALLFLSGCTSYHLKDNLSYDPTNVPFGVFDLYEPSCSEPPTAGWPVLFYIHGGAWMMGGKNEGKQFADEFCKDGYAVVSIDYRLSVASMNTGIWPAQIEDCQKALDFVTKNAALFRLNSDKIASVGISAGGNLATMIALRGPVRTKFMVDVSGEQDMTQPGNTVMSNFDDIMTKVLGHPQPWSAAELRDISPVFFARQDVSAYVVHSDGDTNVYFANAGWIVDALKAKGADVTFVKVAGDHHGDAWSQPESLSKLHAFLDARLK